jgi:hypothetical protein
MLEWAAAEVARRQKRWLRLDIALAREPLLRLYERAGFRNVHEGIMFGTWPTAFVERDVEPGPAHAPG